MSTRYFILVISSLYIKDISCLQNDPNNVIMNNLNGGQSQGIIQKSLNQIASNRGLPINLQQILNSRQSTNGQQQQNTQQNLNTITGTTNFESTPSLSLQSLYQQSSTASPTQGYHQTLTVQRPALASSILPNASILQNNNYADQQNLAMGNVQFLQQQTPGMVPQTFGTQPSAIISQSYPNAPIASAMQPVMNVPASYNGGNINVISESSLAFPQNQQVPIMGVPYVINRSEPTGYVQTQQFPTATVNSPPITFLPQENLQTIDLSHIEYPNQMAIVNSASPQLSVNPSYNPQQILENYLYGLMMSPNTYGTQFASGSNNSGSKSSTLKLLLPLILNMLREKNNNNCDCCPNCGCNNNNQQLSGDSCGKQNRYGYKQNQPVRYSSNDSSELDNRSENENRLRSKRKNKKVKIDDSYEDYDRDDDYD